MPKKPVKPVYIIKMSTGNYEDYIVQTLGITTTMTKALSFADKYVDELINNYRNEGDIYIMDGYIDIDITVRLLDTYDVYNEKADDYIAAVWDNSDPEVYRIEEEGERLIVTYTYKDQKQVQTFTNTHTEGWHYKDEQE